jgi:hypothetical protein
MKRKKLKHNGSDSHSASLVKHDGVDVQGERDIN